MSRKHSKKPVRPRPFQKVGQHCIEMPDFSKVPPVPYIFGYARVSTVQQRLDLQMTVLKEAGCKRIFTDKLSGKTAQRHQFKLMLKHLQRGDTILVYSLSRLFRNTKQLLELFDKFKADGITLRSLTEPLDLKTSYGRMAATMLAAVDEAEVGRTRERTIAGMDESERQGVKFGAPPKVTPAIAAKMKTMRFKTGIPVPAIARQFSVSAAAVYQHTK
jgi:DNA invertase Pin-like site-specific DNA recombinase